MPKSLVSPAQLFSLLPAALVLTAAPLSLRADPVALVNPTLTNITEGAPEGWRAYPPATGELQSLVALPGGGVHLKDADNENGLGFGQFITAIPGHEYKLTVKTAPGDGESGSIFATIAFLPKRPAKMAMINKTKVGEAQKLIKPGEEAVISGVAPAGTNDAWVIFYSPKATKGQTDIKILSVALEDVGGSTENAPPALVRGADPTKKRSESETLPPGTVKVVDFETGDMSQTRLLEGDKPVIVSAPEAPTRHGKYAMKTTLTHEGHRSEMSSFRAAAKGEYKYGWSLFLPQEFDGASWFSIVTQWHSWGTGKDYPMEKPGPPTSLIISKNAWQLKLMYQEKPEDTKASVKYFDLGPIDGDKTKWSDFVMEVNWQGPTAGTGYLRLFKNGKQILDYNGPTWFDDKLDGPFFKMGTYKGSGTWKGEEPGAVLYADEFRMTDTGSRDDVDPAKVK